MMSWGTVVLMKIAVCVAFALIPGQFLKHEQARLGADTALEAELLDLSMDRHGE